MITVLTPTIRAKPGFKNAADSLVLSAEMAKRMLGREVPFELVVVDGQLWNTGTASERRKTLSDAVAGRFPFTHVAPKPCAWQGPHRLTTENYPALNNARNTGLCYAKGDYIIHLDDCIIVHPQWLAKYAKAAKMGLGFCGRQVSVSKVTVKDGMLVDGVEYEHPDSRGMVLRNAHGSDKWGMNAGEPLSSVLACNGFDEIYDGQFGGDDVDLGVRLERAGLKSVYDPSAFIYQILDDHNYSLEPVMADDRKTASPGWVGGVDKSDWKLNKLSDRKPKELTLEAGRRCYANETLIERLGFEHRRTWTVGNYFDIADVRAKVQRGEPFPPHRHTGVDWRDGQRLEDMA